MLLPLYQLYDVHPHTFPMRPQKLSRVKGKCWRVQAHAYFPLPARCSAVIVARMHTRARIVLKWILLYLVPHKQQMAFVRPKKAGG